MRVAIGLLPVGLPVSGASTATGAGSGGRSWPSDRWASPLLLARGSESGAVRANAPGQVAGRHL